MILYPLYIHMYILTFHISPIEISYSIHYSTLEYTYHFLFIFWVHFLFRFRSFSSKFELKWSNVFLEFIRNHQIVKQGIKSGQHSHLK